MTQGCGVAKVSSRFFYALLWFWLVQYNTMCGVIIALYLQ
jgi:hypothetical protein